MSDNLVEATVEHGDTKLSEDAELLLRFVEDDCQDAFRQLVDRYIDVVFAAARRQVRDAGMAQDVTQAVFMVLAKKARSITGERRLTGWLLQVTRFAANNALRERERRQHHERRAAEMKQMIPDADPSIAGESWNELSPLLDEGIARLKEHDRGVLLARFFERRSTRELAEDLGISEAAAEKRVTRAVEKLRGFFRKRGVVISAGALAAGLTAGSAHAAPSGLNAAIASTVLSHGAVASTTSAASIAKGTVIAMAYAKTKTAIVAVVLGILLVGGGAVAVKTMKLPTMKPPTKSNITAALPGAESARCGVRFTDGSVVELVSLTDQPGAAEQWWGPDGTIVAAPTPLPRNLLRIKLQPDVRLYQFIFRERGNDLLEKELNISFSTSSQGSASNYEGDATNRRLNEIIALKDGETTVDVVLQLGFGQWSTLERYELTPNATQPAAQIPTSLELTSVIETSGVTAIKFRTRSSNLFGENQTQIRAITVDGQEIDAQSTASELWGVHQYDFPIAKSKIVAMTFRFRPYDTREIHNVSLSPGVKTALSVTGAPH